MKEVLKVAGKVGKVALKLSSGYFLIKGIAYLFCSPNYERHHPFGL